MFSTCSQDVPRMFSWYVKDNLVDLACLVGTVGLMGLVGLVGLLGLMDLLGFVPKLTNIRYGVCESE